jgi:hypothetical protein
MRKLESRLFFFLLNRWANYGTNRDTLRFPNGIVCLTKNHKLQVKEWEQS